MNYEYVAYDQSGRAKSGRISASGALVAMDLLSCAGYKSIDVKPVEKLSKESFLLTGMFKVKPTEVMLFYRQLALLLESGVSIVTSLQLLQAQYTNRAFKKVLEEVLSDLRSGNQLSACLRKHPEVFAPIYCRTIQVGEQTGNLEAILRQMADYMEKELAAAKGVKNALMYPIITAIVAVLATTVIVTFVLPAFARLYGSFGVELPFMTRMLMMVSGKLRQYGIYLLLAMAAGGVFLYVYSRTEVGKYQLDKMALKIPLIGRISHLKELARCGRSISVLFRAGLPMPEIMAQLISGCNNRVIANALTDVRDAMVRGEGLSEPMAKSSLFLPMFVQMVRVGEETGTLDSTLMATAESYEVEVADRTTSLIALIQPAMTILVGLGVGFIALTMVSTMYTVYSKVLP